MKITLKSLVCVAFLLGSVAPGMFAEEAGPNQDTAEKGVEILRKMAAVNRYWLESPPETVQVYSYAFHLQNSEPKMCVVKRAARTGNSQRQGITYSSVVHALARKPESVNVRNVFETDGVITLSIGFNSDLKIHCGNGLESSWRGYFSRAGDAAQLILDAQKMVPLKSIFGGVEETFSEFVQVDEGHFAPLSIQVKTDSMELDWTFRVYQPGLWLFDFARYRDQKVAWIDSVKINDTAGEVERATVVSVARENAEQQGTAALRRVLDANRHWLLPSLAARRNLVYEYLQEAPYREVVLFSESGDIMVELAASKESPERPTRQRLWSVDGTLVEANYDDPFVRVTKQAANRVAASQNDNSEAEVGLLGDRSVQNLAMGLGIDCALTRLAREPDSFWGEVRAVENSPDRYLLVLHPKKDVRLFTGTMLMFTSWAYMHDVRFSRSELLCDAATLRVLEERDYDRAGLKAQYWFEDYIEDPSGAAPGQIRALVRYEKNNRDQSLEMRAQFQFAKSGVWLLDRAESAFRGGAGTSTGTLRVLENDAPAFEPIQRLRERTRQTTEVLRLVESAPKGAIETHIALDEWQSVSLQPSWSDEASKSRVQSEEDKPVEPGLIGLYRGRVSRAENGRLQLELEGVSTASWKEFETKWIVEISNAHGEATQLSSIVDVRAERSPTPFTVKFDLPSNLLAADSRELRAAVQGRVERMTGAYHGHGLWMRFAKQ